MEGCFRVVEEEGLRRLRFLGARRMRRRRWRDAAEKEEREEVAAASKRRTRQDRWEGLFRGPPGVL